MTGTPRRGHGRTAAFVLVAAASLLADGAAAQQLPNRPNIDILVVSDDPVAKERMAQWSRTLQRRLSKLKEDGSLGLRGRIVVTAFPDAPFNQNLQTRWVQRRAIQIVLAQGITVNGRVTAEGDIFLGGLKGDLARPSVPIKQPITPENFQKASDYIVMTSLYALAIDAGAQKPVACALLRQASLLGKGISAQLDSANVKGAVAKRLAIAKCAIGR